MATVSDEHVNCQDEIQRIINKILETLLVDGYFLTSHLTALWTLVFNYRRYQNHFTNTE